jgi:nitrogen fixation protein FixH
MRMIMSTRKPLPETERLSDYEAGGKPLNGWRVLAMIVAFFLFVGAVNGVMIYKAVKTFSGEVVAHPYERGLAYNSDIARAREQAVRDWKVEASLTRLPTGETEISVSARDAAGAEIAGVEMSAVLVAPADLSKDVKMKLAQTAPGRFSGKVKVAPGQRDLVLTALRGGEEIFRSRNRIDIE